MKLLEFCKQLFQWIVFQNFTHVHHLWQLCSVPHYLRDIINILLTSLYRSVTYSTGPRKRRLGRHHSSTFKRHCLENASFECDSVKADNLKKQWRKKRWKTNLQASVITGTCFVYILFEIFNMDKWRKYERTRLVNYHLWKGTSQGKWKNFEISCRINVSSLWDWTNKSLLRTF